MRIVDVLYSLPSIIFVIVLIATLGDWLKQSHFVQNSPAISGGLRVMLLFVGLGAISWLTMARIVRGQVLSLRTRAFGLPNARVRSDSTWPRTMRAIVSQEIAPGRRREALRAGRRILPVNL